ncbi:LysR family transcriptional regulator [Jejubacter calystegiae]|uniref:LysR family transcriptional regulator n=1 Tax=Jejubacter calystegiae TaxID=2579935 RepID=A0A4P8YI65_9ENTR|nr:LysR substrate-binding domain-containing protein [Jejubacter calystegiae]QCT19536.1 LysR family transcriptional regulator [Jejubacter calystegiae]
MISERQLSQFIAVAEELHFGRAALRLNMAQPPLSQAIKRLEAAIGVPLFIRDKHSVTLTPAGKVFLDEARELQSRSRMAVEAARRAGDGYTGKIVVGFVGSVSYELVPGILSRFRNKYPSIHIDLREQTSAEQLESLRSGCIDVGVLRLPLSNTSDIDIQTVATEKLMIALPEHHSLAGKPSVALKDLSQEKFMNFPADKVPHLHSKLIMACDEAGFSPNVVTEAWQITSILSLVSSGMGVALLPAQARSSHYPGVIFRQIAVPSIHLELKIAVACRKDDASVGVSAMVSVINEAGEALSRAT